jgi:16S rRNA (uracil1498-N3)-methyltransferase
MRTHRFYIHPIFGKLEQTVILEHAALLHQWYKVLRYQPGQEVVLFDGEQYERVYKITTLSQKQAYLELVDNQSLRIPDKDVYLCWALLKRDKNDLVLQKGTELGVNHFIPLVTQRSERKDLNLDRARRIVTEAAEQCGRGNIPTLDGPLGVIDAIGKLPGKAALYYCHQEAAQRTVPSVEAVAVFIGPEGGWTSAERTIMSEHNIASLKLSSFTLRAETACVVATGFFLR